MKRLLSLLIVFLICAAAQTNGQPAEKKLLPEAAQAAYDRGMEAVKAQDWKAAIQSFAQAQKASPNRSAILFNLGLAHARADHEIPAMAWLRTYLSSEPTASNAAVVRAEIRRLEAQAQDRITKLFQAAAAAAEQVSQGTARGRAIGQIAARQALWGNIEGAFQTTNSLKLDGKTLDSLTHSLWRNLALYRASQGDLKGAQESLRRAPEEQLPARTLNFDSVDAKSGPAKAQPYVYPFRVMITKVSPGTRVEVVNADNLYSGKAAKAPSPKNLLTQTGSNDPVSFTLYFLQPLKSLSFKRAGLLGGPNGIIHPAWSATALNPKGGKVNSVGEDLLRSFTEVPARTFTLKMKGSKMVQFTSDSQNIAAFSAVLLDDLVLSPASQVQDKLWSSVASYYIFLTDFDSARKSAEKIEDPENKKQYINYIEKFKGKTPQPEIAFRAMYATYFSRGRKKAPDWQILYDPKKQLKEIAEQPTPEKMIAKLISSASVLSSALRILRNTERRFPPLLANAQDYLDRGMARYQRGDLKGVIEDFSKAMELDPSRKREIESVIERVRKRLKH